jgi:exodeoxyribonuclease VII small subunit
MSADEAQGFEARLARLQEIVARLESGGTPLEESVALYKEGLSLAASCRRQLDDAVNEVTLYQDGLAKAFAVDTDKE